MVSEVDHPERLLVRLCASHPIAIRVNDRVASVFDGRRQHDRIRERELRHPANVGCGRGEIEEQRNDGDVRKCLEVSFSGAVIVDQKVSTE